MLMGLFGFLKRTRTDESILKHIIKGAALNAKSSPIHYLHSEIFKSSLKLTEAINNQPPSLDDSIDIVKSKENSIWFSILAEFIYCHLKIADLYTFQILGEINRVDFMGKLVLLFESVT